MAKNHSDSWRKKAKNEYKFVAGHQWSDEDLEELRRKKRPAITFNLIGPNVKAIAGMEQGNRHELKYTPREKSEIDGFAASIYNQTARWILDRNDNEFRESQAFRDMAICGMGWTQMRYEFDDDPDGMVQTPAIDPLLKYWDPASKEPNLTDRRFDFTLVRMDRDKFDYLFPDTKATPSRRVFDEHIQDEWNDDTEIEKNPDNYEGPESSEGILRDQGLIAVLEMNYFRYENVYTVIMEDGSTNELNEKNFNSFVERSGFEPEFVVSKRKRHYKAFFTGDDLIEPETENADPNSFTDHCITGEYDRSDNTWFGVVRAMVDPQNWSNKLFSQLLHIINSNSKGGFFYRKGAFQNKNKALRDWAKGDMGIEVNADGSITDWIHERQPLPLPSALHEVMMYAAGIIPRVSGFNMELLGLSGKDQPGVLENMRKQAGMTILAPFFDSLRRFRKLKGRTLLHFMREFIGIERISRILDDETRAALEGVWNLPGVEKFDIHVDEAPHSPNLKANNFLMLMELGNTNPDLMALYFDILIEQSPLPQSLINEIKGRYEQSQEPGEEQIAKFKAEMGKIAAETFEKMSKGLLNLQKTETESDKPELEREKLEVEIEDQAMNLIQTQLQTQNKVTGNDGETS